jgi:dolichol-phosphate mannosyltransferase
MYAKIQEGNDLVIAMRANTEGIRPFEKLFSRFYSYMIKRFAISTYPEGGFDVFMITGRVKEEMKAQVENNSSILLQLLSFGFKMDRVNYDKKERRHGKSKWSVSKKIKLLVDSFIAFSFAPIRFVTILGILMFVLGFIWSAYIILLKLFTNSPAQGWPTLISVLMMGFGVTNISLGIIAEYLWRTLDVARGRKVYIIDKLFEKKRNESI